MGISSEYLERIITDWAQNLWLTNLKSGKTGASTKQSLTQDFNNVFYKEQPPETILQRASNVGFGYSAYGLAYMSKILPKASNAISNSRLFDAWRTNLTRRYFQPRYDVFQACVLETLDKSGSDAVAAQYPDIAKDIPANDVIDALREMNYKSTLIPQDAIIGLIRKGKAIQQRLRKPAAKKRKNKNPGTP